MKQNVDVQSIKPLISRSVRSVKPYTGVLFFLLIAAVYGFLIFRINVLSNAKADQDAVISQVERSPTPRIDDETVRQLQSLQDNSVNVQALFEENRTNPFQE